MSCRATVLVPTHNHGPLLTWSVRSALRQRVREIEVLIVGDGMDDATRRAAFALAAEDDRVRVYDRPKGPRLGEVLRHAVLADATGEIVCYLSDDDVWLPTHVEVMHDSLRSADFANTLPLYVNPDRSVGVHRGHFGVLGTRARMFQRWNFISLTNAGHTLALYRNLPHGWRTSPPDVWTDLHMWRQIVSHPGCRVHSSPRATVVHLPSPDRRTWTMTERLNEIIAWYQRLSDPDLERELQAAATDFILRRWAEDDMPPDPLPAAAPTTPPK